MVAVRLAGLVLAVVLSGGCAYRQQAGPPPHKDNPVVHETSTASDDVAVPADDVQTRFRRGVTTRSAIDALFGLRRWAMDLVVYTPQEVKQQRQYRNSLIRVIESEGKVLYEQPR